MTMKGAVVLAYMELVDLGQTPTYCEVARMAKVSHDYTGKVISKFWALGFIEDPKVTNLHWRKSQTAYKITLEVKQHLIALGIENDQCKLKEYRSKLQKNCRVTLSVAAIDRLFWQGCSHSISVLRE